MVLGVLRYCSSTFYTKNKFAMSQETILKLTVLQEAVKWVMEVNTKAFLHNYWWGILTGSDTRKDKPSPHLKELGVNPCYFVNLFMPDVLL